MTEEEINPQRDFFFLISTDAIFILLSLSSSVVMMENTEVKSQCFAPVSVRFWIDLLIKEVLRQHKELSVLLSDTVSADELELLESKLVELILHLPHIRLLQLGDGLFSRRLLLARLPQVGLLTCKTKTLHYSTVCTEAWSFQSECMTNVLDRAWNCRVHIWPRSPKNTFWRPWFTLLYSIWNCPMWWVNG